MERKYMRRFQSYKNSLSSLSEARERDMSDSFVLSGTGAKFSITFEIVKEYCRTIVNVYIEKLKEFQLWAEEITD